MTLKARAFKYGDDINTDYIISGKYKFKSTDMEAMAVHTMEELDSDYYAKVKPEGGFLVAGTNFGMGPSREQAPLVLIHSTTKPVLAKRFARIFYRHANNTGLQVGDVVATSAAAITEAAPVDAAAVRREERKLIRYSDSLGDANRELRKFLYSNVYYHPRVAQVNRRAGEMLRTVFQGYVQEPERLGDAAARRIEARGVVDDQPFAVLELAPAVGTALVAEFVQ
mgnify:CR=1 FL=1